MSSSNNNGILVKAEVVSGHKEDPKQWNRVQVYIPAYHGEKDENKVGADETGNVSKYPWAQSNISVFKVTEESDNKGFWETLFSFGRDSGNVAKNNVVEPLYPEVGDIVWVTFEGGDIRKPICVGVVAATIQQNSLLGDINYGDLASIVAEVLSMNEGSYTSINWNDNGATSIGKAQWNANRCKNMLIRIRGVNQNAFDTVLSNYGASDFLNQLNENVSWNNFLIGETSPRGRATKEILGTDYSKEAQDSQILEDCQVYIEHARSYNITDPAAIIYYCDVENQWGQGGAADLGRNGGNSLDSMHQYAMSHKYGQYATRRNNTYNKIKELQNAGKLNLGGLVSMDGASMGGSMLYPCPGVTTITANFGIDPNTRTYRYKPHSGVDFGCPTGTKLIAVCDGDIDSKRLVNSYGNHINLRTGNMRIIYAHLSEIIVPSGHVTAGTVIGLSGNSGNSSGAHLHFEIRVNGSAVNPLPYIKG